MTWTLRVGWPSCVVASGTDSRDRSIPQAAARPRCHALAGPAERPARPHVCKNDWNDVHPGERMQPYAVVPHVRICEGGSQVTDFPTSSGWWQTASTL